MWYRLKSSLLTATLASLLVLGFLAVAERNEPAPAAGPLLGLGSLDAEERAALQLAVALTALAIDAAVESRERKDASAPRSSEPNRQRSTSAIRMPFYSFASKSTRQTES